MDNGKMPSMVTALGFAIRNCHALIYVLQSFQAGSNKSLWIKFGLVPESSKLSAVNKAFDVMSIGILRLYNGLRMKDDSSCRPLSKCTLITQSPVSRGNQMFVFVIASVLFLYSSLSEQM